MKTLSDLQPLIEELAERRAAQLVCRREDLDVWLLRPWIDAYADEAVSGSRLREVIQQWVATGCVPEMPETAELARVREYYRARPDQVADLEAQGYRVVGGHVYAVDDVSLLAVRQCWCVAGACVCGGEPRGD